jgi:hypothetical protein
LIDADRIALVGLMTRASSLADASRLSQSADSAARYFRRFEGRVTRALLLDPSVTASCSTSAVPFFASFVEAELFLTGASNFGSVAYCNWSLLKRKLHIDDSYFDLVEQTSLLGLQSLDALREAAASSLSRAQDSSVTTDPSTAAMANRLDLVDRVLALPEGKCSLESLISVASSLQ